MVINTMGWVEGLGYELLLAAIEAFQVAVPLSTVFLSLKTNSHASLDIQIKNIHNAGRPHPHPRPGAAPQPAGRRLPVPLITLTLHNGALCGATIHFVALRCISLHYILPEPHIILMLH